MPKTIRARIALLLTSLMLAVLSLSGGLLYFSLRAQLQQTLDDGLRFNAEQLLSTIENQDGRLVFGRGDLAPTGLSKADDLVRLVLLDGTVTDSQGITTVTWPTHLVAGPGIIFATVPYTPTVNRSTGNGLPLLGVSLDHHLRLVSAPVAIAGHQVGWLQVGLSMTPLRETLNKVLLLLLLMVPLLLVMTAVSGYWLAGQVLQPIETIRRQAAAMSARDLQQRLNLALPDDEVGRLALTFDQMLNRLEQSFRAQQRFVSDASHELRTPLAVIRGEVDVTLEQPRQPAAYVEALQTIGDETGRMERLVTNLLWLARTDDTRLMLHCEPLDLADLLQVLIELLLPQAEDARVKLKVDLPPTLPLLGDADRLIQVFTNLLENAFTYAPGSTVCVQGQRQVDGIAISISDTGPGIAPPHLPHLFERFYRVDQTRNHAGGGSGLGLAIAQEIVRAHGGTLTVQSAVGQGTRFIVKLMALGS